MSHVFSSVGHFLTSNLPSIAGAALGTAIAPGIGTALGAGLGSTAGGLAKGEGFGKAALGGLESGALSGVGSEFLGSTGLGSALSSGLGGIGSAVSSGLGDVGLGGVSSALSGLGSGVESGLGSLGSSISSGLGSVGSDLGITGPGGLTSDVSNWWSKLAGPSTFGAAAKAAPAGTETFAPGFSADNLPLTPTAPPAAGGGGTILGNLFGGGGGGKGGGLFGGSPALGILAAAPVALQALRGSQPFKGETQLQQSAAQLGQQGQQLQSYLQSGTLPPGAQAAINQATESAKAAIRSQYAAMGMSGSSAEAQDLANAEQAGVTQSTNMAMQLLSSGIQSTQMSDQLYTDIMNQSMQEDQDLSSAIGNFAYMAGGGTGGLTGGTSARGTT